MKWFCALMLCVAVSTGYAWAQDEEPIANPFRRPQPTKPVDKDVRTKASYSLGVNIGQNFKDVNVDVDLDALVKGLKDALAGKDLQYTQEELAEAFEIFQADAARREQERLVKLAAENKATGEKFLEENKKKPGVTALPSGLQYKIIKEGTGKTPTINDNVTTHYRGRLIDGTEFDSSFSRNQPAEFPVRGVIPGWTEALQLMKEGAKWEIYVPAKLAYGERGNPVIGPNETLIFEIELLRVGQAETLNAR